MNSNIPDIPIRDIHVPMGVSWWPPAIGWWLLLGLIALLFTVVAVLVVLRSRRRYKRIARSEFHHLHHNYLQALNAQDYVRDLSCYLRRTAMHFYSREVVAGLTGKYWLQFLDTTLQGPGAKQQAKPKKSQAKNNPSGSDAVMSFQSGAGNLLLTIPYNPDLRADANQVEQLTDLVQRWISALPVTRTAGYTQRSQAG